MNKQTYLARLAQLLASLPEQERQDALNYYEEYFDAAGAEAEEATAAELGDPADAARKILEGEGITPEAAPDKAEDADKASPAADPTPAAGTPGPDNAATAPAQPSSRSRITIPPLVGVLLGIAVVLAVALVVSIALLGVRSSSSSADAHTELEEFTASSAGLPQETAADGHSEESATDAPDDTSPRTADITFDNLSPEDTTLDIDYGRLTITAAPGVTAATLHAENARPDFLSIDHAENEPLTIRYKTPANYNLSRDPEPEFVLTVPEADAFCFKTLSISSAMGNVVIDSRTPLYAHSLTLSLSMGSFTGGTVCADSLTADVSMGTFTLGLLQGAQAVDVQASMGNIALTLDGAAEDYSADLQAAMGETTFNGQPQGSRYTQTSNTDRSVTLISAMGNVALTITQ